MLYNIDFDIAATLLSLFIVFYIVNKKGLKSVANRFFLALSVSGLIAAIADIFSSVENSNPDPSALWKQDIWNYLYLAMHNSMPFLLLVYILFLLGIGQRMRRRSFVFLGLPLLFDFALLLANPFSGCIFYYSAEGIYLHGDLFIVFYVIAISYMIAVVVLLAVKRRGLPRTKLYPLIFLILMTVVSLLSQIRYPYILMEIFAQTLGLLGILFSIENQDDIIDHVTRALNRYAFLEIAPSALSRTDSCFLAVKLPHLDYYNTTAGIDCMNELQREIAHYLGRLDERLSCYDCGNGHFVLLGNDLEDGMRDMFLEKIAERFKTSWGRKNMRMTFPVQLCSENFGKTVTTMEELLLIADSSFDGNETKIVSAEEIIKVHKRRILIESLIRDALEKHSFQVYYQPIWDRAQKRFCSAEALIRLISPEYGYISPEEFIPIAEQNGQITEIGEFVFEEVCHFYQSHQLDRLGVKYVEVNLSTVQCMNQGLTERFEQILGKYKLKSEHINLEITESAAAGNQSALKKNVDLLDGVGFTFSLDDYGTGYSNFSYMFDLPFSIIKLDKSILWKALHPKNGPGGRNSQILLANNIRMMKEMGYHTLVEGVETVEQKMLLEELGCDYFQGYYFSKPVPGEVFLDFIKVVNE